MRVAHVGRAGPAVLEVLGLIGTRASTGPMSTLARAQPGDSPATKSTVRTPAAVATVKRGGDTRPPSTAAWARQRMPLPLISASRRPRCAAPWRESQPWRPGPTRMIPSAPTPRRRSQSRRTWPTESRRVSSGSSTTMKSFPAPSCLLAAHPPVSQFTAPRCVRPQGPVEQIGGVLPSVGPHDPGVAPEPRRLAAGERPGPAHGFVHCRRPRARRPPRAPATRGSPGPGGPFGRCRRGRAARARTSSSRPSSIHRPNRSAMRRSTSSTGTARPTMVHRRERIGLETGPERRERLARAERDLERPHHPALVGRLHPRRPPPGRGRPTGRGARAPRPGPRPTRTPGPPGPRGSGRGSGGRRQRRAGRGRCPPPGAHGGPGPQSPPGRGGRPVGTGGR